VGLLDHLSDEAVLIGTVNCVHRDSQDALVGENTEGKGFCQSLVKSFDCKDKNIVILGAGSSARAIAVELARAGAGEITIVNRTAERGQQLADLLIEKLKVSARFCPWNGDFELFPETDLVVNATSIGEADPSQLVPLAIDSLTPEMVVADVVLGSPATAFLRAGEARGCQRIHGQEMMVEQLFWCVQFWLGTDPNREVMRESLEEYLEL
jgi:shikimate dehydrogenase